MCAALDAEVEAFRTQAFSREHPDLWIDATYHKVRQDGRVQSMATVVAIGVTADGERQVLGLDAGSSEDAAFWTAFLRSPVKRGLRGVRLLISDAREGRKQGLSTVRSGASWQRWRVHFMRNLLATVPHAAREPVAALVRTIFAQPDHATALAQLHKIADGPRPRCPQAAALLAEAAEETSSPIATSRVSTGLASTAPTRSSACTRRSSAARQSWASSRIAAHCSASLGYPRRAGR